MPIYLTNDKYRGRLRSAWISSPADTNLLVDSLPANIPTIVVAGYGTTVETVFSATGSTGTNASNYVLTGVTRLRGANVNLPENTTLHCIAVEEFFNQYAGVASTASGIANLLYGVDSGASDAYEVDLAVSPGSYTAGLIVYFTGNTVNTGAATIDINGLGVKDIKKYTSDGLVDLEDGDIQPGQIVPIVYDGTRFLVVGGAGGSGGGIKEYVFFIPGTLSAGTNVAGSWFPTVDITIESVSLYVDTAGASTGSTVIDVNDDGASIMTTKPTLTTTQTSNVDIVPTTPAVAANSKVTIDIDSITATPPVTGYVYIRYTED